MLTRVVYSDGSHDFVNGGFLTFLIVSKGIIRFKRFDGWVKVPSQDVRNAGTKNGYAGPERRRHRDSLYSLFWPDQ